MNNRHILHCSWGLMTFCIVDMSNTLRNQVLLDIFSFSNIALLLPILTITAILCIIYV